MSHTNDASYVRKARAYVTREPNERLVFEGPELADRVDPKTAFRFEM